MDIENEPSPCSNTTAVLTITLFAFERNIMAKRNSSGIPAVGYIRMSTGRQENSPARQRAEIEQLAQREGYRIVKWYEDHGLTGTESANRPEFQRLLQDAERGRFQAILLHEQVSESCTNSHTSW
ncbi:MAG: hypothetical protein CMJ48_09590 [Planctomycetaceae bacterium]|nr:hypothetical protein [Planctomycetaceae bacterium]